MRLYHIGLAALAAAAISASPARAADPVVGTASIKGADVMGDKGRSGPDGWSWAPQTRDQAPADKSTETAAKGHAALSSQSGPDAGKSLKPGDDPGTPVAAESHGPGAVDSGTSHKP